MTTILVRDMLAIMIMWVFGGLFALLFAEFLAFGHISQKGDRWSLGETIFSLTLLGAPAVLAMLVILP